VYSQPVRHTGTVPFSFFLFHFENLAKLITKKIEKIVEFALEKQKFPISQFLCRKNPNFARKKMKKEKHWHWNYNPP
jgi:hypothetical protein